ncbi:DUF1810 family protein [Bradyrhizobium sp. 190]|nr:DUF1810 family protein [Bradyrhizobium sp. 190]
MTDAFDLQRFLDAQTPIYARVLAELRRSQKQSHWMWFIFPQVAGLGHSAMAQRFAIASRGEAVAYLGHAVLGFRLKECTEGDAIRYLKHSIWSRRVRGPRRARDRLPPRERTDMRLRRVTSRAAMRGGRSTGRSRLPAFSARPARRPARRVPPLASGGGVREFESLETEFQGFEFSRTRTS